MGQCEIHEKAAPALQILFESKLRAPPYLTQWIFYFYSQR